MPTTAPTTLIALAVANTLTKATSVSAIELPNKVAITPKAKASDTTPAKVKAKAKENFTAKTKVNNKPRLTGPATSNDKPNENVKIKTKTKAITRKNSKADLNPWGIITIKKITVAIEKIIPG